MKNINKFLIAAIVIAIISLIASIANAFVQNETIKLITWIVPFLVLVLDMMGMFQINWRLNERLKKILDDGQELIKYQLFLSEYENEYRLSEKETFSRIEIIEFLEEEKSDWQLKEYSDGDV